MGSVHRDLKPGNIFLAAEGQRRIQPKIVDFGIAKLPWLPPHPALPEDAVLGTPAYMAPEQARGSEEVDSRADVWSFCVVLYELVSGAVPFPGAGTQVFRALAQDPVPSLANRDGIDPALWSILERGLAKNPDDRWPSIRWVGEALAEWLISRG